MKKFFYPESIVVIGVSNRPTNLGRIIVTNLLMCGFKGLIYSVGPQGGVIFGQPIHKSLDEIDRDVDLAVILTPAKTIPRIMEDCGRKGIRHAIIESSGFTEFSEGRKDLERQLLEAAQKWNIRFIGPNGIGIINTENGAAVPFVNLGEKIPSGHVAVLAQSGGVGLSYLNFLRAENLGLSKFVSMGNKLNVTEHDLLEYLIDDPQTKVIMMYLEDIKDGKRIVELAKSSPKPILIHKANVGDAAHRIAASHTAALTADDRVVSAAFRQAGIIRVNRFQTALNYIKVLTLPPLVNNRLGVVSRSGGHAVIAADACDKYGFELPSFSRKFLESIEKHFRASVIKLDNPLDLGDLFDLELYVSIVDNMLKMHDVDGVLLVHAYSGVESEASRNLIKEVGALVERYNKPVAICIVTSESELSHVKQQFDVPIFASPEEAAESLYLSYMKEWWGKIHDDSVKSINADRDKARQIITSSGEGEGWLTMAKGFEVLECYGIDVIPWRSAHDEFQVQSAAGELGYPVVIKADLPSILHKTEAGAVKVNIKSPEELSEVYKEMASRLSMPAHLPVMVQAMASPGREILMGAKKDRQFGPIVLLGLGGIFVEALDDVTIRTAPITEQEARDMVDELKGKAILKGVRGQQPSDIEALSNYLLKLSHLVADFPEIQELDVNPLNLFESGRGGAALDIRIRVKNGA